MENCCTFKYDELPLYCFRRFHDMKKKSEFCDITIKYGNHSITAHRLVVAAAIPYFRDLLGNKADGNGKHEILVEDIDPKALESLIEYAYTCQIKITSENAKDLFAAACFLKIDEVRDACCRFLAECLNVDNALSTRELAESFSCAKLLESVNSYMCRNFDQLTQTELLNSSFACVKQLIESNDLQCSKEENVFEFVIKWVKTSPETRKNSLPQLLQEIRMSVLTPEYLTYHVSKEELIRSSVECRDIVDDAKTYHFLPQHRSEISSFVTMTRTVPKKNISCNDPLTPGIYAVSKSTILTGHHFDGETAQWTAQKTGPLDIDNGVLLVGDGILYYYIDQNLMSLRSENSNWNLCGKSRSSKNNFGAAFLNNKIYFCGEDDEDGFYASSVECYDLKMHYWKTLKPMLVARYLPGVVALGEHLYVLGGLCDEDHMCNCVEKYDPKADLWVPLTPMLTDRYRMGCAAMDNKIYVCGGIYSFGIDEPNKFLASVEVYDILSNKWSYLSSMRIPRFACSFVAYSGKLYVIGGFDENEVPLNTIDVYDPATDEWKMGRTLSDAEGFVQAVAIV